MGASALHCITDKMDCCNDDNDGNWFLPGQTHPIETNLMANFIINRITGAVLLNRRNEITSPAGVYVCELPDSDAMVQKVSIFLFNVTTRGQINSVENHMLLVLLSGLSVTNNKIFQLDEITNISCTTPVPVQFIQWLDESNTTVRNGTAVQDLELNIMITASSNNTMYTCRVRDGGRFMESMTITIQVIGILLPVIKTYYGFTLFYLAPTVEINTTGNPVEGDHYNLTCSVSGYQSFIMNATVAYEWLKNSTLINNQTSLIFGSIDRSDSGTYTCQVTISSLLLNSDITVENDTMFQVTGRDIQCLL